MGNNMIVKQMQTTLLHISDSVALPIRHQQNVYSNGTLVIHGVTRDGDEGTYSCTAEDKQERSDTQTLNLQVRGKRVVHFEDNSKSLFINMESKN